MTSQLILKMHSKDLRLQKLRLTVRHGRTKALIQGIGVEFMTVNSAIRNLSFVKKRY